MAPATVQRSKHSTSATTDYATSVVLTLMAMLASVREKYADVKKAFETAVDMKEAGHSDEEVRAALEQNIGLQAAVITVVVAGATAYAGISVMSSIGSTLSLEQGDMFYNSSQALETGINDFFTNLPTVFVVIALVLIIGYLTILR